MKNIYGLTIEEMEEYFLANDSKKFHALQLFTWLYEKRVESYEEITNIKKEMLDKIKTDFSIDRLKIVDVQEDVDVCKYLFELYDGEHIEAVLMRHDMEIVFVYLVRLDVIWVVDFVNQEEERKLEILKLTKWFYNFL